LGDDKLSWSLDIRTGEVIHDGTRSSFIGAAMSYFDSNGVESVPRRSIILDLMTGDLRIDLKNNGMSRSFANLREWMNLRREQRLVSQEKLIGEQLIEATDKQFDSSDFSELDDEEAIKFFPAFCARNVVVNTMMYPISSVNPNYYLFETKHFRDFKTLNSAYQNSPDFLEYSNSILSPGCFVVY
jgi:hypothetical protein